MYDIVNSNEEFPELMIFGEPTNNDYLVNSISLKNGFISSIIFTLKSYFEDNSVSLSFIFFA